MNGAWAILLVSGRRRAVVLAAVLACAAALFSARGFFILGGVGAYCIFRCINRRDTKLFLALAGLAAAQLAVLLALWFANPDFVGAAVKATFITPIGVVRPLSMAQKLGSLTNLMLVALYIGALAYAVQSRGDRRQQVVAFAVASQLILLALDPAPYNYVYGWAAIPAIAAVADFSNKTRNGRHLVEPLIGIAITALFAAPPIAYLVVKGHQPPYGSTYRLVADASVDPTELARLNDAQLAYFSLSAKGQETLQGQLATFAAICARFQPTVLTRFALNPVCLRDTQYEWTGLTMPSLSEHPTSQATKRADFVHAFASRPPTLFIWKSPDEHGQLDPWVERLLTGYEVHDGYAIRQFDRDPLR